MRWPWQPKPGMRRVKHRELIRLLRAASRAAELEAENAELAREAALLEADSRAHQLLQERRHALGLDLDQAVHVEVMAALPLTVEGRLHEPAFLALVEDQVWAHRERELVALVAPGATNDDSRGA